MMQVHANRCSWNGYIKYSPPYTNFINDICVTEDTLRYRFINLETNRVIFNFSMTLDEFRKHPNFDDQTWWTPYNKLFGIVPIVDLSVETILGEHVNMRSKDMCALLTVSASRDREEKKFLNLKAVDECGQVPLRIFVPSKQHNFTNFCYQITIPREAIDGNPDIHNCHVITNIPANIDLNRGDGQIFQPFWQWYFCPMDLTSVDLGDRVTYKVVLSNPSSKDPRVLKHSKNPTNNITIDFELEGCCEKIDCIYLQSKSAGIQDMVIHLDDGVGEFTLPKLEDVKFKLGYKYFTGVLEYDNGKIL